MQVEEEILGKAYDGRLMRRLLGYMAPYRMLVAISLAFLAAQSLLQGLGPLLTKIAVDKYLAPTGKSTFLDAWLPSSAADGLARIALLYLAVLAGNFITEFAQTYIMQYTGQLAMFDLRKQLVEHLQRLDLAFYDRNPVGRLVTRVTSDVDVLNDLFTSGLVTIVGDVLALGFIVFIMLRLSPMLTLIMMLAMPFVIFATSIFRAQRARKLPSYSHRHRPNQLLSSGAHHGARFVLQLFNREHRSALESRRRKSGPHAGLQGRRVRLRVVLSGGRVHF